MNAPDNAPVPPPFGGKPEDADRAIEILQFMANDIRNGFLPQCAIELADDFEAIARMIKTLTGIP
jgi:hypothetical protein